MSASLVATLETLALIAILRHRQQHFGGAEILRGVVPMAISGLIMAGSLYILISQFVPFICRRSWLLHAHAQI
jgi:hypothetical protein